MEERLEYRLYCMQGDLERLKYDYKMEYRKIDWMNARADMYLSRVKISCQVIMIAIMVIIALHWGFVWGGLEQYVFVLIREWLACVVTLVNILILLLVVLPWLLTLMKNLREYLKNSNKYGNHIYSMIRKKDYQKERKELEANVAAMSNKMIQMEFEIEQLTQQVIEKQEKEGVSVKGQTDEMFEQYAEYNTDRWGQEDCGTDYEKEEIKYKSCEEIQRHLYHLENIERNLQKQYDREYSITQQIEDKNTRPEHYIRKSVIMFFCGLGGLLVFSLIKIINLKIIHNDVMMYATPILGIACVFVFVMPAAFMIIKELLMRYMNKDKFIGKEYMNQMKEAAMSSEQAQNEKALTEISQKLVRIQLEKEDLKELLQEKLQYEDTIYKGN